MKLKELIRDYDEYLIVNLICGNWEHESCVGQLFRERDEWLDYNVMYVNVLCGTGMKEQIILNDGTPQTLGEILLENQRIYGELRELEEQTLRNKGEPIMRISEYKTKLFYHIKVVENLECNTLFLQVWNKNNRKVKKIVYIGERFGYRLLGVHK